MNDDYIWENFKNKKEIEKFLFLISLDNLETWIIKKKLKVNRVI